MKKWEKELKRYQLSPPPPQMEIQEYILKYLESGDEMYLRWFLHAVEPKLNQTASAMVQHYAMYGFFLDLKQACVEGIWKALQVYDPGKGPPSGGIPGSTISRRPFTILFGWHAPDSQFIARMSTIPCGRSCRCIRI